MTTDIQQNTSAGTAALFSEEEEYMFEPALSREEQQCFTDRELSWLEFNLRVLREAGDAAIPLLERLKFMGIYESNLEEFFMVRVGSLTHRALLFPDITDRKTGWTAAVQLKKILSTVARQQERQEKIYRRLMQDLRASSVDVLDFRKISKPDEAMCKKFFTELRPLLSPCVVDGNHPFPFVANHETCVASFLKKGENTVLGLVSLERVPPCRVYEMGGRQKVIITADLVRHFSSLLFRKYEVRETAAFRVTRNADVFLEDCLRSADGDFRAGMEKMLRKRKRQQPVRLVMNGKNTGAILPLLRKHLKVPEKNAFVSTVPFDLSFGSALKKSPDMKYPERRPVRSIRLKKGEFFPYLEKKDLFLSFPFQSISPFTEMLYEAADDPDVLSIKITLYRLSATSKVAAALAYAADRGKDVLCLLELRARFDEQNNIDYSEMLEDAGCQIIYGLPNQKVHSKLCLITRRKGEGVSYITQVGTGNYNEVTSEHYTDISVITSNRAVGEDASAAFDALAMGELPPETKQLWVAPNSYRSRVLKLIERETAKGENGRISIKVNSMNDLDIMRKLVDAGRAGVRVELFIRGICCLKPGIPGKTENIRVKSTIDRHLEHSRIFSFGSGEDLALYVGSGDLLNRNTRRRVEAFVECSTPETREPVLFILDALRKDSERAWFMQPDGTYLKPVMVRGTASQDVLYDYFTGQIVENIPEEAAVSAVKQSFWRRLLRFLGLVK